MATLFLLLIYVTFISLGLPDSLLGAAWPMMHIDLGVPLDAAGLIALVVGSGTVVSSLLADKAIGRFGTGRVTFVSCFATAVAMLGFSLAPSYAWLLLMALPLGLGAGAIDTGLNNYVALHYAARHMSWLHCFWGVGAFAGPTILSLFLAQNEGWRAGYRTVAIIQLCISALLFFSLPLWKRFGKTPAPAAGQAAVAARGKALPAGKLLRLTGVKGALCTFFVYCGFEYIVGLWASSYFAMARGFSPAAAALAPGVFYGCIAVGRFASGLFTMRFSASALIRMGVLTALLGAVLLALPFGGALPWVALALVGLGAAPIFPGMVQATPSRFGAENSQKVIGYQLAASYLGTLLLPPLSGVLSARVSVELLPFILLALGLVLLAASERANRAVRR